MVSDLDLDIHQASASGTESSFQTLHAFHNIERLLEKFVTRSAVFDVVFFKGTCRLL